MRGIHALHVITGEEMTVKKRLREMGFRVLCPRQWLDERRQGSYHRVLRVLMPGYIFIEYENMDESIYYMVRDIPDVLKLLNYPEPLPEAEAKYIRLLSNYGMPIPRHVIDISGNEIIIKDGILKGGEHRIKKISRRQGRTVYEITIGGETKRVSLSADFIT